MTDKLLGLKFTQGTAEHSLILLNLDFEIPKWTAVTYLSEAEITTNLKVLGLINEANFTTALSSSGEFPSPASRPPPVIALIGRQHKQMSHTNEYVIFP